MIISILETLIVVFFLFLELGSYVNTKSLKDRNTTVDSTEISKTLYDVVIVGGGPAGLSALSSLARVRRSALLIDSGKYRNDQTRNSHDVIGSDGLVYILVPANLSPNMLILAARNGSFIVSIKST